MPGRKRTPDHLKVVTGTFRPDRKPQAPHMPLQHGLPDAPAWLSARASQIFEEVGAIILDMNLMTIGDGVMLAMLASRIEEVEACTAVIEDLGRSYAVKMKSGDTMFRARPEVAMRNDALRHAQSLLVEFGLSPAARAKVTPAGGDKGQNPFAALEQEI